MAAPDVRRVLAFLRQNGFDGAASALREDVLARDGVGVAPRADWGHDGASPVPPWLPPVRVAIDLHGGDASGEGSCSESSSSAVFLSMGSSPSGLTNPYGLGPAYTAVSEDSSDHLSQFGTARDCDDPNLFCDPFWEDPYLSKDSGGCGFVDEDKFIMSMEAEEHFVVPKAFLSGSEMTPEIRANDYFDMYTYSDSPCDCDDEMKERRDERTAEQVDLFKPLSLEFRLPGEGFRATGKSGCQPKLANNGGDVYAQRGSSSYAFCDPERCEDTEDKKSEILEKKLEMLSSFTFSNFDPLHALKSRGLRSDEKEISALTKHEKDFGEMFSLNLYEAKAAQENGTQYDGRYGKGDGDAHNLEHIGGRDDHSIRKENQPYDLHEEYEEFNLKIIHRKNRTGFEESKDFPIVLNSIIAGRYYVTEYLGSAAFSKVVQAHDLLTGIDVCLKIIKNNKDFFDQSLDEIKLLKLVNKHDPVDEHHVLRLYDYFYYQEHLFIVCELLRANLYEFQKFNENSGGELYFTLARIQKITRQCLEALEYLHRLGIIHCDLKPENILFKSYSRCEIKIIDLGSSCFCTDNLCLYVQSRSYRAPEVILGLPYGEKIDIWSLGCILAELFAGDVLFPNDELVLLLARMIGMFGPIDTRMLTMGRETHKYFTYDFDLYRRNEETDQVEMVIPQKSSLDCHLQGSDRGFLVFLEYLLQVNPQRRPTANQALQHPWLSHLYR